MRSRLRFFRSSLVCSALVATAASSQPVGPLLPGFGSSSAPPRMLIIMDTSRSMAYAPNGDPRPAMDFSASAAGVTGPLLCNENAAAGTSASHAGTSGKTAADEGQSISLSCPPGDTIIAIEGVYGKKVQNTLSCSGGPTDNNTACGGTSTMQGGAIRGWLNVSSRLEELCRGNASCTISVANTNLGPGPSTVDPCNGVVKHLQVKYRCGSLSCTDVATSNKFCMAKRVLYEAVNANSSLLEISAGGYFQTIWQKLIPPTNSSIQTTCSYDLVASAYAGVGLPANSSLISARWSTNALPPAATGFTMPAFGTNPANFDYNTTGPGVASAQVSEFQCAPESNDLVNHPYADNSPLRNRCDAAAAPAITAHRCFAAVRREQVGAQDKYQNTNPGNGTVSTATACTRINPGTGGFPGSNLVAESCLPPSYTSGHAYSIALNSGAFRASTNSDWDTTDSNRYYIPLATVQTALSNPAATCGDAPGNLINMVNGSAPADFPSGPALAVGSCTAGNPCAYHRVGSMDYSRPLTSQTRYCDPAAMAGPQACPTAASLGSGWAGPTAGSPVSNNNLSIAALGAGGTCPASLWFTGNSGGWNCGGATGGGCWITRTAPASSTPMVDYSCPGGYSESNGMAVTSASTCRHDLTRYSDGLTLTNSGTGGAYAAQPGATWSGSYRYRLSYASVRDGLASCVANGSVSTVTNSGAGYRFPADSVHVSSYAGGFPMGCGNAASGNEGTATRCQVQGNSYAPADVAANGGVALGRYYSDSGTVECEVQLRTVTYRQDRGPNAGTPYCTYQLIPQTYTQSAPFCRYERFVYRFARNQLRIWSTYNAGDYRGTMRPTELTYPATADDPNKRCGGVPSPHASWSAATGFTLGVQPAGPTTGTYAARQYSTMTAVAARACAVELAPGENGCPAAANGVARCKLRWSGPGNNRFRYQVGGMKTPPVYRSPTDNTSSPLFDNGNGNTSAPIFCPVGDPQPQASAAPENLGDAAYASTVTSWCKTTNTAGVGAGVAATPAAWEPAKYVADVFHATATNPAGSFNTPTGVQRYQGVNIAPSTDQPWGMTPPFSNGDQHQPKLRGTKLTGLSVLPPYFGVVADLNAPSFARWAFDPTPAAPSSGDEIAAEDPLPLFDAWGAGNPAGLRMPDLGDITPLAGALDGAKQYITAARAGDGVAGCRRYSIMLLTDGLESPLDIGNDPRTKIDELRAMGVDTYVIGFGNGAAGAGLLNEMAQRAGTSVNPVTLATDPGGVAYDATNYNSLTRAVSRIIGDQLRGVFTRSRPSISSDGARVYSAYFSNLSGGAAGAGGLEFKGHVDAFVVGSTGAVASTPLWRFDQKLNGMTVNDWFADANMPASGRPRYLFTRVPGRSRFDPFEEVGSCSNPADDLVKELNRCGPNVSGGFNGDSDCDTVEACGSDARDRANQIIRFVRNDRPAPNNGRFVDDLVANNVVATKESRISDVFHSNPFLVGRPSATPSWTNPTAGIAEAAEFSGTDTTSAYAAFKARPDYRGRADLTPRLNLTTREPLLFVQSNTGTVHAIREDLTQTDPGTLTANVGTEKWAYVPRQSLQKLDKSLVSRRFLADGSFAAADVCFEKLGCERADGNFDPSQPVHGGWFTLLVGGLGRLGPHLFAMDITDPRRPVWLWDFNPNPANLNDDNMGDTLSAPVIARVNVHNKAYEWGVFVGGGFRETQASWDNCDYGVGTGSNVAREGTSDDNTGNAYYVLDANPGGSGTRSHAAVFSHGGHQSKWCIPSFNKLRDNAPPHAVLPNVQKNNVPGRLRVWRPNEGSRAYAAYFGDTDGKLWRSRVTSDDIEKWAPGVFFNPFDVSAACVADAASRSFTLYPLPDQWGGTVPPASGSLPLAAPLQADGLPKYFTRPFLAVDDVGASSTGAMMLYAGSGDVTHPEVRPVQNYFWAIEDRVTTSLANADAAPGQCAGIPRWGYSLDKGAGEKVLGDPAIIGTNIIVAVYVPYGGAGGCGQAGYSKLYCFNRATGEPQFCLADNTNCTASDAACDQNSTTVSGQRMSRFVRAGQGIISDLRAVGNTIVFTTSTTPDTPNQVGVINANVPFRIKSWRRVR
ncbi:MAG: hypothetical protein JNM69_31040 [Archangium sp.]|nr:hypothetical protein [Archangium sp.]